MQPKWLVKRLKTPTKVEVSEVNLEEIAQQIIVDLKKVFGANPLAWSDDVWEEYINPWIDEYIFYNFKFSEFVEKTDLDDAIAIALDNEEIHPKDSDEE